MDKLDFESIEQAKASWLERDFEEEDVRDAVFKMIGNKAPGLDGFPLFFFQRFWSDLKHEVMALIKEFHDRDMLSKNVCIFHSVGSEN